MGRWIARHKHAAEMGQFNATHSSSAYSLLVEADREHGSKRKAPPMLARAVGVYFTPEQITLDPINEQRFQFR